VEQHQEIVNDVEGRQRLSGCEVTASSTVVIYDGDGHRIGYLTTLLVGSNPNISGEVDG